MASAKQRRSSPAKRRRPAAKGGIRATSVADVAAAVRDIQELCEFPGEDVCNDAFELLQTALASLVSVLERERKL